MAYIKGLKSNDRNWWESGSSPWDFANLGSTIYGGENQNAANNDTGSIGGIDWPTQQYNLFPSYGSGLSGFEMPEMPGYEPPGADPTNPTFNLPTNPDTSSWADYLSLATMGSFLYGAGTKAYNKIRDWLGGEPNDWEALQSDWDAINSEIGMDYSAPESLGNILNYSPTSWGDSLSSAMDLGLGNALETDVFGLTPATEYGSFMESIGGGAGLGAAAAGLLAFDTLVRLMPGGDPEGVIGGLKKTLGTAFGLTDLDSMTPEQAKAKLGSSVEYLGRASEALLNGGQPGIYNWLNDPLNAYSGAYQGMVAKSISDADIFARVAGYSPEETQQFYVDALGQDVADAVAAVRSAAPGTTQAAQAVNTETSPPIETYWQQEAASKGDLGLVDQLALLNLTDWYDPSMAEQA